MPIDSVVPGAAGDVDTCVFGLEVEQLEELSYNGRFGSTRSVVVRPEVCVQRRDYHSSSPGTAACPASVDQHQPTPECAHHSIDRCKGGVGPRALTLLYSLKGYVEPSGQFDLGDSGPLALQAK